MTCVQKGECCLPVRREQTGYWGCGAGGAGGGFHSSMMGACGGWRDGVPEYLGVGGRFGMDVLSINRYSMCMCTSYIIVSTQKSRGIMV